MSRPTFDPKTTLFLIDGSSFLYRAYYGMKPLHTKTGMPVQAVYSFCRMLKKLIDTFHPQFMVLVWDSKGPTERHAMYEQYKATRDAPPSDLFEQKVHITEFADLIGLHQVAQPGVEADDLMYALACQWQDTDRMTVMVTSDKDMRQALSDRIVIFDPFKDEMITAQTCAEKMGFPVSKLPFYFALVGDSSDNIPGVAGIGPKGATDLVQQFDSLDDLYANLDKVPKERTRTLLQEHQQDALISHKLFLLRMPSVDAHEELLAYDQAAWANGRPVFEKFDFTSLLKGLPEAPTTGTQASPVAAQPVRAITSITEQGYTFHTITTGEQLHKLVAAIRQAKIVAVDTETMGYNPLRDQLVGISLCCEEKTAYYVPFLCEAVGAQQNMFAQQQPTVSLLSPADIHDLLGPVLADVGIKKIMHHAKFDILVLRHAGFTVEGLAFDTLVAASLVTKDWQRNGLKFLSEEYLQEKMQSYEEVVTKQGHAHFACVPLEAATAYAAADAHQTLRLYPLLESQLRQENMEELYTTVELPLVTVLTDMEQAGIYCDVQQLQELDKKVTRQLSEIEGKILKAIGARYEHINLNSPKQLEQLLFHDLKLPPQKKRAKGDGYSTDQEVLQELAKLHPVPRYILAYRELFKLKSTYIDALPTYVNPEDGRIHTTFSQTKVATGRLASSDPNLQNIPSDGTEVDKGIRHAFEAMPSTVFLSSDYSQIELRILAHLTQDKNLLAAFHHGEDIHAHTAAGIFGVKLAEVTHDQRQLGKRINFSIIYGLTPFGLSQDLGISLKDAREYIAKYFAHYPAIEPWMEEVVEQTKRDGYVTTLMGRRRYIPGIYEHNKTLYALARRIAINSRVQGSSAEIVKMAMLRVHEALAHKGLKARLLLQIHDELLVEVPQAEQDMVFDLMKTEMESVVDWEVPLKVSIRMGKNWADVTK